jgi:hypothetical protein
MWGGRAPGQHTQSAWAVGRHNPIWVPRVGGAGRGPDLRVARVLCQIRSPPGENSGLRTILSDLVDRPRMGQDLSRKAVRRPEINCVSSVRSAPFFLHFCPRSGCNARRHRGYDCDDRCIISPRPSSLAERSQTSQFTVAAQFPRHYILLRMWAVGARTIRRLGTYRPPPCHHAAPRGCGPVGTTPGRLALTCEELRDVRNGVDGCCLRFG